MKYYANFLSASGNTSFIEPLEDTNKKRITKEIIEYAKAYHCWGSTVKWHVHDERDICVAEGLIQPNGRNMHIK